MKNSRDNDLNDKKLTKLDSTTVNRNPTSHNEVSNKKYVDDELDKSTIVRFNRTLRNYLEVSVENDTYDLTKYDKIQITGTTKIKTPEKGGSLSQNWVIHCNDKNGKISSGKISKFVKATKTNSPISDSGASSVPPIGDSVYRNK